MVCLHIHPLAGNTMDSKFFIMNEAKAEFIVSPARGCICKQTNHFLSLTLKYIFFPLTYIEHVYLIERPFCLNTLVTCWFLLTVSWTLSVPINSKRMLNFHSRFEFAICCWKLFCSRKFIKFLLFSLSSCIVFLWFRFCMTQKRSFHVLVLATTPFRWRARCIPTYSYCIYYWSLPSASVSVLPSSLLKVPLIMCRAM